MAREKYYTCVVMSDSHGDRAIVEEVKERYMGQVDALFHNGDSELEAKDPLWDGIQVVGGNCDYDRAYPDQLVTTLGDVTIAQTHGHLYGINFTWMRLDYWAEEVGADICLYGHLHVPDATVRGKTLFVNPGSIRQPRGMINECLYAILTIFEDHIHIEYCNRNHQVYAPLTKDIPR
ncbi:YfcE family phosphodiesterase [Streptococcus sp. zg-86]|uniref:Phosphoesterase n=1 Tax=Streptococcus zhangguiae TaxID=2664091 RepID=A0A6I4R9H2_9STRE|nr:MULTISPECIES: metallophosphoesterase [unclassified Streptococcus]MTB64449.1 YfcE family phosphodiesterase [Streptococcus sp. zg-86]MTB90861.1 YfcE family phosphodiesterase [Streptococcus sp. zg-36]MWV56436.1 YfcE family phosphodiesterase [Streptococcus sp. zg-70]QTH47357.1 metallophosphoesterase [Streptococcus sp. zg-86]